MTLQDAQPDGARNAALHVSATAEDLAEMPTNPLLPGILPVAEDATPPVPASESPGSFPVQGMPTAYPYAPAQSGISVPQLAPAFPPAPTPALLPVSPGRRLDSRALLSLGAAGLLLILSIGALIGNFVYYQPYRLHAAATATGIALPTITAHAAQTNVAAYEQTNIALQTATTTAQQMIYQQALKGKPVLSESLKQQSPSGWDEGVVWQNASCTFENDGYVVYQPNASYFVPCFAENPTFGNFALQVDLHILKGDFGGVFFRADSDNDDGYLFEVDNYGDYGLYACTDSSSTLLNNRFYDYQTDQKNRLTVIAKGNTLYFYLNQHFVDSTTDSTFTLGHIGLISDDTEDTTTVVYSNLKIWQLF